MTPVLLSNPGLPLAIYGNPVRRGKKRRAKSRRRNPVYLGSKAGMWATNPRKRRRSKSRRNPVYLGSKAGMWATNPGLKRRLAKKFPGWRIASVKVVGSKRRRKSKSRRNRAARRNPRKAPMARTKSRRRRAVRSKRTGRFLSRRTKRFQRRRARTTVGRTYRRKGAWVKVQRAHIRRRKGRRVKNRAVKWSGRKGKISYSGIGGRKGRKGIRRMRFTNPRRRRSKSRRRNPGPSFGRNYVRGLTSAPGDVMSTFKNFNLKKGIQLAGGTIGAYVVGGIVSRFASPYVSMIPVVGTNALFQRVAGAAFPYTAAFIATKALDLGKYKHAALLGGAVASILEFIVPGQIASLIQRIPGLSSIPGIQGIAGLGGLSGPAAELAGYVQAPSYAGVGQADALAGYVQAPSYAGVGQADALAGYVQAPSYAGVGNADYLTTDDYVPKASYLN